MELRYPRYVPGLVAEAKALATQLGFDLRPEGNRIGAGKAGPSACTDAVGSLLRCLAAGVQGGRVAEVGTGAGVGTAWLASGLGHGSSLTSVEIEPSLAAAVGGLFADRPDVTVISGSWEDALPTQAPFHLVFFDGGGDDALEPANWTRIADLLTPGGVMVLDDLTPEELWPAHRQGSVDPKRELAFNSGAFIASELMTGPASSVLLLVRTG